MRSISHATLALAALLVATPLASAYASTSSDGYTPPTPMTTSAPHAQVILGQLDSLVNGITADRDNGKLTPAEATRLQADAHDIRKATLAAAEHGQMTTARYDQLLKQVGQLSDQVNPVKMD